MSVKEVNKNGGKAVNEHRILLEELKQEVAYLESEIRKNITTKKEIKASGSRLVNITRNLERHINELALREGKSTGSCSTEQPTQIGMKENGTMTEEFDSATDILTQSFQRPHKKQRKKNNSNSAKSNNQKKNTRPNSETITVTGVGLSYADILKSVKSGLGVEAPEKEVLFMRRNRNGGLDIKLREGSKELRQKIEEKMEGLTVKTNQRLATIHIKGLDCEATYDQIMEAVTKMIGYKPSDTKVTSLRPAYGQTQNATLKTPVVVAQELLKESRIRVGWISCRLQERKHDIKCYRCWATGHVSAKCTGPDRSKMCFKCGEEGHLSNTCVQGQRCIMCSSNDHRTGDKRCSNKSS
jgi:hypothetical protein